MTQRFQTQPSPEYQRLRAELDVATNRLRTATRGDQLLAATEAMRATKRALAATGEWRVIDCEGELRETYFRR